MHELQSLLLQKLPRLGELTFWCEVFLRAKDTAFAFKARFIDEWRYLVLWSDKYLNVPKNKYTKEILGHPFTHADILEVLGDDWAMTGDYELLKRNEENLYEWNIFPPIKLPQNLKDLNKPEYKETCERLISLIK